MVMVGYMCMMFLVMMLLGIFFGMLVFYMIGYDDSNLNVLMMEGIFGLFLVGIFIYMVLVDLVFFDFFYNKMMLVFLKLKKVCYIVLVFGFVFMLVLVFWV